MSQQKISLDFRKITRNVCGIQTSRFRAIETMHRQESRRSKTIRINRILNLNEKFRSENMKGTVIVDQSIDHKNTQPKKIIPDSAHNSTI